MSDVLHTAVRVTDLDAISAFYEDTLGLEKTKEFEAGGYLNYFVAGGSAAEIQFQYDEEDTEPVEPSGIGHLAVGVDDLDAAVAACVDEHDSEVVNEAQTFEDLGLRAAFVTDPEGYTVELIEDL